MSELAPAVYTVVLRVRLDMDTSREHRQSMIEEYMVPEYWELPGFHLATWMNDGEGTDLCVIEFDSEDHTRDAVLALTRHGGPEFVEWGVYSVEFEASA
jgi:hypothetical protein